MYVCVCNKTFNFYLFTYAHSFFIPLTGSPSITSQFTLFVPIFISGYRFPAIRPAGLESLDHFDKFWPVLC